MQEERLAQLQEHAKVVCIRSSGRVQPGTKCVVEKPCITTDLGHHYVKCAPVQAEEGEPLHLSFRAFEIEEVNEA